jgi:hypothetical protein
MNIDPDIVVNPQRKTSVAFRRFNRRHASLSSHYWTHVLGTEAIKNDLKTANPNDLAISVLGAAMKQEQYGFDVATTLASLDEYLNTSRLHILAICLAQLEGFLKEFAYCVARIRDPSPRIGSLSPMAAAMAKPILGVDSLPGPLEFSQDFFEVALADEIKILSKAYDYRCAAVHNGGYATAKAHKRLGRGDLNLNQRLSITWSQLQPILAAAFGVADKIDMKWGRTEVHTIECEVELENLKSHKKLPNRNKVWAGLANAGFRLPSKSGRAKIAAFYYTK